MLVSYSLPPNLKTSAFPVHELESAQTMTSSSGSSFVQWGFFCLHLAWEKEVFSPIISIRLAKVMAWGGFFFFFSFFLFFLRKEADMLTRTMEDNLGEGEGDGCAGENLIFEY